MLSIIIPTFQEENNISNTLIHILDKLNESKIDYEIIVIDDNSNDKIEKKVLAFSQKNPNIHFYLNDLQKGFGNSIVKGVHMSKGKYFAIMMADLSDSVDDLVKYYEIITNNNNLDCVFGDRWSQDLVSDYPFIKKTINRAGNFFLKKLTNSEYSDFTNSFKLYSRKVFDEISPIISNHFSITVELPLKIITRGYKYKIIPNTWQNRKHGVSKMNIRNIILTYSLITIYCLIDKYFWKKRAVINK